MASILIVDDSLSIVKALRALLQREGYTVYTAASGEEALATLEQQDIDLLLCDVIMPQIDGLTVLQRAKVYDAEIAVVMISGQSNIRIAVDAMKEGAYDYLVKPLNRDQVLKAVQGALAVRALQAENLRLKRQVRDHLVRAQVIGSSPAWRRVCQIVEQIAPSQATVLLTGESGTGKEIVASLVHRLSPRAAAPFVVLNAAAMPATLLEAELFGYEKGAFTGAIQRKPGHFELADGGTLFLDEIGDMPFELQAKLLRVLQDGTFKRLGGTQTVQVDVRVVAATNKDLAAEVRAERFRHDLYYRLNVITLSLPPLRERRQDIPLLAMHFLRKYAQENRKAVTAIQPEALHCLQSYDWPGNVRELENVMERAVVLAREAAIGVADLHLEALPVKASPGFHDYFTVPITATMAQIEREAIVQALQRQQGNHLAVARRLDIGPSTLYRKIKEYQIQLTTS
jgi:DNA-binding NtrC family response regulator